MNESGKDLDVTIQLVKNGNDKSTLKLYRWLYHNSREVFESAGLVGDNLALFQDAFLVLEKRIQQGRFALHSGSTSEQQSAQLKRSFERILAKIFYRCQVALGRVLEGIRREQSEAVNQLVVHLNQSGFVAYSQRLAQQFKLRTVEAGDFHSRAVQILIDKIRSREFELNPELSNDIQLKQLAKFFNQIMYRQVSRWQRDEQRASKRAERYIGEAEAAIAEEAPEVEIRSIFGSKAVALFDNLDEIGRYILRAHYLEGQSAKQIAKRSPFEAFQSTETIHQKRIASLKKLSQDLFSIRTGFSREELLQLARMTEFVIGQLIEPCRSILHYAFPPENKNPAEIAVLLQQTRPRAEISNLGTAAQVKKRKYKCKLSLWDKLWKELLNPEKN